MKVERRVKITKNLIKRSNVHIQNECIGANALRKAFPKFKWVSWGTSDGSGSINTYSSLIRGFKSFDLDGNRINMMDITEPCEIILKEC